MLKGMSRSSGSEQADVHSPPLVNPGVGFELLLWLSWWHKQRCAEPPNVCFPFSASLDKQTPFRVTDL
jgi:hypothetical protein